MRVRPTSDQHRIVVAFPWRHRERAQEMGRAVADVLDAVPSADVEAAVSAAPRGSPRSGAGVTPHTPTRGCRSSR